LWSKTPSVRVRRVDSEDLMALQFGGVAVEPVGEPGTWQVGTYGKRWCSRWKNISKEILFFTFPRRVVRSGASGRSRGERFTR
jgi:hypothetical protein